MLKIENLIKHIYQVFPRELCEYILVSYFIHPGASLSTIIYTVAEEIFNGDRIKAEEVVKKTLERIGAPISNGKIDLRGDALRRLWILRLLPAIPMALFSERVIIRYTYPLIREGKEFMPENLALMNQHEIYKYGQDLLEFLYNLINNSPIYMSLLGSLYTTQVLTILCEGLVLRNTRVYTLYPEEGRVDNIINGKYVKGYEWGTLYIKTSSELEREDSLRYYYNPSRRNAYFRGRVHLVNRRIIIVIPKRGEEGKVCIETIGPLQPMRKTKIGAMIHVYKYIEKLNRYLRYSEGTCYVSKCADVFTDKKYIYVIIPQVQ